MGSDRSAGSSGGRGLWAVVPFLLFFAGVFCLGMYLYQSVVEETAFFGLLVGDTAQVAEITDEDTGFVPGERMNSLLKVPAIRYGRQFARLNVDWQGGGWTIRNVPVYLGSDKQILKKGAGMSFGSAFPGEHDPLGARHPRLCGTGGYAGRRDRAARNERRTVRVPCGREEDRKRDRPVVHGRRAGRGPRAVHLLPAR